MRVTTAWIVGLIAAGGSAAFCTGLARLFTIGTCASGNSPYVIALPCPAGTATQTALLIVGLVVAIFAMTALAFLVTGGWKIGYSLLFLSAGVTSIVVAATQHGDSSGSSLAAWIIAATFLPMGAWPPLAAAWSLLETGDQRGLAGRGIVAPATVAAVTTEKTYPGGEALINVSYRVQGSDGRSFDVERSLSVLPAQMPKIGQRVQIRYDRRKPTNFTVEAGQI